MSRARKARAPKRPTRTLRHSAGDSAARPELIPQPHGGAIWSGGLPGNRGGGRPPDEFRRIMADLASDNSVVEGLQAILNDPSHPSFLRALEYVTDRGYGGVSRTATVEVSASVGELHLMALKSLAAEEKERLALPAPTHEPMPADLAEDEGGHDGDQ